MRKYQKAAVVMAMLGSASFLGAGVSQAADGNDGNGLYTEITPTNACSTPGATYGGLISLLNGPIGLGLLGSVSQGNQATTCATEAQSIVGLPQSSTPAAAPAVEAVPAG
jgi:hypothetical protein